MSYQRKTKDRWDIMTNWGYGWECENSEYTRADAKRSLREYRENLAGRADVKDVNIDCESETLKELALYPGEPEAYCYIDSTEGEYLPVCGGDWNSTSNAGVFGVSLFSPRTGAYGHIGFRSAYFRKLKTE